MRNKFVLLISLFFSLNLWAQSEIDDFSLNLKLTGNISSSDFRGLTLIKKNQKCEMELKKKNEKINKRNLPLDVCRKIFKDNALVLDKGEGPLSEYYLSQFLFGELTYKGLSNWSRLTRLETHQECTIEGKCQEPIMTTLRKLSLELITLKNKHF